MLIVSLELRYITQEVGVKFIKGVKAKCINVLEPITLIYYRHRIWFACLLPSTSDKKMRIFWLWYPLISIKNRLLILSFPIFLYTNKIRMQLIKNNCYYYTFNLTCLFTMSHSYFSKCLMIITIVVRTMVLAIKFMSLYMN